MSNLNGLDTKFKVGDEVWFSHDTKGIVTKIVDYSGDFEHYEYEVEFGENWKHMFFESKLYSSQIELVDQFVKNNQNEIKKLIEQNIILYKSINLKYHYVYYFSDDV